MQNYNLPSVNFGNTFGGVEFTLEANPAIDLQGATCKVQVRKNFGSELVKEFSVGSGISITQPNKIKLEQHVVEIPAGEYKWDLKIVFSDSREKTYVGGSWTINNVITTD